MRACDNPFRVDRVQAVRYRFLNGDNWESLLARLQELQYRAAIVGAEGSGKTTLHEELALRLESQGHTIRWLRLNRENGHDASSLIQRSCSGMTPEEFLFVDGAEQLGALRWQLFKRWAGRYCRLVINTHVAGRLPTFVECRTSPELLHEIVCNLVPHDSVPTASLQELHQEHRGNIRLCLRSLYDQWADSSPLQGGA